MQTCHSCEKNTTHKSWYSHTLHNNELSTGTGISRPAAVTDTFLLANLLTLNSSKTEFLIIGLKQQISNTDNSSLNTTHSARNLGFIFDEHLTISSLSKSCYSYICELHCICPYLDSTTASSTTAVSIVHFKLYYCNSLYYTFLKSQANRLQQIQNSLSTTCG